MKFLSRAAGNVVVREADQPRATANPKRAPAERHGSTGSPVRTGRVSSLSHASGFGLRPNNFTCAIQPVPFSPCHSARVVIRPVPFSLCHSACAIRLGAISDSVFGLDLALGASGTL